MNESHIKLQSTQTVYTSLLTSWNIPPGHMYRLMQD